MGRAPTTIIDIRIYINSHYLPIYMLGPHETFVACHKLHPIPSTDNLNNWNNQSIEHNYTLLVGGIPTPLKIFVSWDYYSQ